MYFKYDNLPGVEYYNAKFREYDGSIQYRRFAKVKGELGIIPGSMTAPGFLVKGKGEVNSIQSASHGAGYASSARYDEWAIDTAAAFGVAHPQVQGKKDKTH